MGKKKHGRLQGGHASFCKKENHGLCPWDKKGYAYA